jgi:hypothetical protein
MAEITTTRSGSWTGGGRNGNALTRLNMPAFTEIPNARMMTATAVNPGFFPNCRNP